MYRWSSGRTVLAILFAAFVVVGFSGCTVVNVYSDSILADGIWGHGEITRAHINEQSSQITTNIWNAVPGTAMGGPNSPHPMAGKSLTSGTTNVVVLSFGTNDASNYASGLSGSYTSSAARLYALDWMTRAKQAGAKCVVWVMGNTAAYADRAWRATYKSWLDDFNGWLDSLGNTVPTSAGPIALRRVSWGNLATINGGVLAQPDHVHPNSDGAAFLGEQIKAQIKTCL